MTPTSPAESIDILTSGEIDTALIQEVTKLTGIAADQLALLGRDNLTRMLETIAKRIESQTFTKSITIMSMVPWDLISPTFTHNGKIVTYVIPAAQNFEPQFLTVRDSVTTVMDTHHDDENSAPGYVLRPVPVTDIADNLIRYWTGDHFSNSAGKYIGVMQIAGKTPTPEEHARCAQQMKSFFEYMIEHASKLDQREVSRKLIGADHHRAIRELMKYPGVKIDLARYGWARAGVEIQDTKSCLWCQGKIDLKAVFCQHCRNGQAEFYVTYGGAPDDTDPYVRDIYNRLKSGGGVIAGTAPHLSTAAQPQINLTQFTDSPRAKKG